MNLPADKLLIVRASCRTAVAQHLNVQLHAASGTFEHEEAAEGRIAQRDFLCQRTPLRQLPIVGAGNYHQNLR